MDPGQEEQLRNGDVIVISDDDATHEELSASQASGGSLLTEAEGEWWEPEEQLSSSQATERSQSDQEPRIWVEASLDRYILRRRKYRQYIAQIGITWTVEETDEEGEDPDPLVEFPVSPKRLAIMDGCVSPPRAGERDPLSVDEEDLRLSGVDEDVLSLGEISLGSLEEIIHRVLQDEVVREEAHPEVEQPAQEVPAEIEAEIQEAVKKGRKVCFRRDVGEVSYRIKITAAGRVTVRALPVRKGEV